METPGLPGGLCHVRLPEKEGKRNYKPALCKGLLCRARVEIGEWQMEKENGWKNGYVV